MNGLLEKVTIPQLGFFAAITYLLTLFSVQNIGEESVYTFQTLEMWVNNSWLIATEYGNPYRRPPLFNWLIALVSSLIGWDNILVAARMISAFATFIAALSLRKLVFVLLEDNQTSDLSALIFITSWQVFLYYGWLGYSDALFSSFSIISISFIWLWLRHGGYKYLTIALVAVLGGLFTKAITIYGFYGAAIMSIIWVEKNHSRILDYYFVVGNILVLLLLLLWRQEAFGGSFFDISMFLGDISGKLTEESKGGYLKILVEYLFYWFVVYFSPWSILLLSLLFSRKNLHAHFDLKVKNILKILCLMLLIMILPYLMAPHTSHRYVLPTYMVLALITAIKITANKYSMKSIKAIIFSMISLKVVLAAWAFPLYIENKRPNIDFISVDISELIGGQKLSTEHYGWAGFAIATKVNLIRRPLMIEPLSKDYSGYFISEYYNQSKGKLIKNYHDEVYLICRGSDC